MPQFAVPFTVACTIVWEKGFGLDQMDLHLDSATASSTFKLLNFPSCKCTQTWGACLICKFFSYPMLNAFSID